MSLPMLTRIKAQNLLSFGPEGIDLELPALTVLIGPNGSGKSNLLETVGLLRAAPRDIAAPIREAGGIRNWIWRGSMDWFPTASVEVVLDSGVREGDLHHRIELADYDLVSGVWSEYIRFPWADRRSGKRESIWERDSRVATRKTLVDGVQEDIEERQVGRDKSVLAEVKDGVHFPELSLISFFYERISLYRQWVFGPRAVVRQPQRIDVMPSPLLEDFSNLGMFLNRLRQHPRPKMELLEKLGDIYSGLRDFELNIEGGTVQIFFTEGDYSIPASRLSDGSLPAICACWRSCLTPNRRDWSALRSLNSGSTPT